MITVANLQGHSVSMVAWPIPGIRTVQTEACSVSDFRGCDLVVTVQEVSLPGSISAWTHLGAYIYIVLLFWLRDNRVVTLKYILFPPLI